MSPKTKTILIAAGAAVALVVTYEVFFKPVQNLDGSVSSVVDSWATSAKIGGAVAVGGGAAWLLLLLFP
jgi:4-hydroxybenzoate polyprenyltransferase